MSTLNEQTLAALRQIGNGEKHLVTPQVRHFMVSAGWVQYRVPGTRDVEFELTSSGVRELKRHPSAARQAQL